MYGLLGKSLSHSQSPRIHEQFGNTNYELIETDDPESVLAKKAFSGINVTIPYKETVLPFLDALDEVAQKTGAVNTIVNRYGKLFGYNTDYFGIKSVFDRAGVDPAGKAVVIIGNGGAAKTAATFFFDQGAGKIDIICRHPKKAEELPFSMLDKVSGGQIVVNCTPVGMYPRNEDVLSFSLKVFSKAEFVLDLIYNPLRTNLIQEAKSLGIPASNGLYMLVAQAARSHELFFGSTIQADERELVYAGINRSLHNIVLVGLPSSGKTLVAKRLKDTFHMPIIDTDNEIARQEKLTIPEIFAKFGEARFRELEYELVRKIYQKQGVIISTGGGMIANDKLMRLLHQNGLVVFLDKSPESIAANNIQNRPLIQKPEDVFLLDAKRRPLYEKYSDIKIKIEQSVVVHLTEIEAKINEYLDNQRP